MRAIYEHEHFNATDERGAFETDELRRGRVEACFYARADGGGHANLTAFDVTIEEVFDNAGDGWGCLHIVGTSNGQRVRINLFGVTLADLDAARKDPA